MLVPIVLVVLSVAPAALSDGGGPPPVDCLSAPPPPNSDVIERRVAEKLGTMGVASKNMVATSHRLATQVGREVLASGGNAVDAFVAAVLAQDMVLPGVTSSAGIAGFLVYDPTTKRTVYVHAPYRTVRDPAGQWSVGAPMGREVLLPGAPFSLFEGQKRFGRLSLAKVLQPVIDLATAGFPIDALYARSIKAREQVLRSSAYGAATFFPEGQPLPEGATLRLPELASTLTRFASQGPDEIRRGRWGKEFMAAVKERGGNAVAEDLRALHAEFLEPLAATYRGWSVVASSGASYGGAKLLAHLKVLEHASFPAQRPLSLSASTLELLARTQRAIEAESWVYEQSLRRAPRKFSERLEGAHGALYAAVMARMPAGVPVMDGGTHSSAVITVDAGGMVVVGTHTIEALNWGQGIFVGGIPLATSAPTVVHPGTRPGEPIDDPLSSAIVFRDGAPRVASTTYGTGLSPGDVQVLTNVLDLDMSPEAAVLSPRLGWFGFDITTFKVDRSTNLLDLRVPRSVICPLGALGTTLMQHEPAGYPPGRLDLGFPTVVTLSPPGAPRRLAGMTPEWMDGVAAGD